MSPVQDICPTARVRLVGGAPATCGRPPKAGSRQGLRYSLPVTKTNSRINQTHCSGISFGDFRPTSPGEQWLASRIENLHCSHAPGPSPSRPVTPIPGLARRFKREQARRTSSPRATNLELPPTPACLCTVRQAGAPAVKTGHSRIQCSASAAHTSTSTSTSSRVSCPAGSSAPLRPHEHQRTYRP